MFNLRGVGSIDLSDLPVLMIKWSICPVPKGRNPLVRNRYDRPTRWFETAAA